MLSLFSTKLCCSDKPGRDVIEVADSMWTIDAGLASADYADNTIVISLAKPEVTNEERNWKKGQHTACCKVAGHCRLLLHPCHTYFVCCRKLYDWQVTLSFAVAHSDIDGLCAAMFSHLTWISLLAHMCVSTIGSAFAPVPSYL